MYHLSSSFQDRRITQTSHNTEFGCVVLVNLDAFAQFGVGTLRTFEDTRTVFTEGVRNLIRRFSRGSLVAWTFLEKVQVLSRRPVETCWRGEERRAWSGRLSQQLIVTPERSWELTESSLKMMKNDTINEWKEEGEQGGSLPKHSWIFILIFIKILLLSLFPSIHPITSPYQGPFFLCFYIFLALFTHLFVLYL